MADVKTNTNKSILVSGAVVLLICWLEVLFFWKNIPPKIPWFFSLSWGENQLMNKADLVVLLGMASFLYFLTSFLPGWTKKGDVIVEKSIFIAMVLICGLLFLTLTRVLMIFI